MIIVDVAFLLDILICFRTTFMDDTGKEVYDNKLIAMQYLKGSFIIDFVAGLPIEYLTPGKVVSKQEGDIHTKFQGLLKFLWIKIRK